MAAPRFVHLRLHTEYSVVDGTARVDDAVAAAHRDQAEALAREWQADFPQAFYVEIQRVDPVKSAALVQASVDLAEQVGLPVVATHPIQFVKPGDYRAHEARVCIAQGYVL